jgi:hypothetical protein
MSNKIKLVVFDGFILGYILPKQPNYVQVLKESVIKGGCRASTVMRDSMYIHKSSEVRLASKEDFDDFNVYFGSFGNGEYEYKKVA